MLSLFHSMKKLSGLLLFLFAITILAACHKEMAFKSSGVNLEFSTDTIFLDTVFTTIGSSTYTLKVFNPANEAVKVDNIRFEDNSGYYRMNVNGIASNNISNVEILPKDSIYIFIEVTPGAATPNQLVYEDKILFENKGTRQHVNVVTLAWDAEFHYPTNFLVLGSGANSIIIPYSIINCNETWTSAQRHVIYGYAVIDEGCELTIDPGTEVFFHQNSGLWVFNGGKLNIAPNAIPGVSDSVTFMGDRLEPAFEDAPGQWGGVLGGIFIDDSAKAVINYAVIKNAVNAIRLDSAQFSDQLKISNSYILNSSRTGIYGGFGNLEAENLVVANSGLYGVYCFGGSYEFRHCTFANYWSGSTRTTPNVALTNFLDYTDANGTNQRIVRPLNNAYFGNCIIYGSNRQELNLLEDNAELFNYEFNHVLFKLDSDEEDRGFDINQPQFTNPLVNLNPRFINTSNNQYGLDSASQAINQGNNIDIVTLDILGNVRNSPDLGAFERQQ